MSVEKETKSCVIVPFGAGLSVTAYRIWPGVVSRRSLFLPTASGWSAAIATAKSNFGKSGRLERGMCVRTCHHPV